MFLQTIFGFKNHRVACKFPDARNIKEAKQQDKMDCEYYAFVTNFQEKSLNPMQYEG